jgi:hypothetical protein
MKNCIKNFLFAISFWLFCCQNEIPKKQLKTQPQKTELTDSIALKFVFGNVKRGGDRYSDQLYDRFFSVFADSAEFNPINWEIMDVDTINYWVEWKEEVVENGNPKMLVIFSGSGKSCHNCAGVCAGAVFSKVEDAWKMDCSENDIAILGNNGNPVDEVDIRKLTDSYGIILKNTGIWQGNHWSIFKLVFYKNGVFIDAFDDEPIVCSSDNWNNAENDPSMNAFAYTSSISFEPSNRAFEDMILHFQGTKIGKPKAKPILLDSKIRFEFKNGRYETKSKLPIE